MPIPKIQKLLRETTNKDAEKFIDLQFKPDKTSLYGKQRRRPFDVVVQWRRPSEFVNLDYSNNRGKPDIFFDNTIEPTDARMGILGDEWFISALAMLAERPALIERLFITR